VPTDPSAESVFSSVTNLVIVKNNAGQIYWPSQSINSIGNVIAGEAYKLSAGSSATITFSGTPIDVSTPISLGSGWNLLAYYPSTNINAATALASIQSDITIVKNNNGDVYWPDFGINNIGNMVVGQGYAIHMKKSATLTYPAAKPNAAGSNEPYTPQVSSYFKNPVISDKSATLLSNEVTLWGAPALDSYEVGVLTLGGELVGSGRVQAGKVAFTLWGQSSLDPASGGAQEGEFLKLVLWAEGAEQALLFNGKETFTYASNEIYQGKLTDKGSLSLVAGLNGLGKAQVFPSQKTFQFSLPAIEGEPLHAVKVDLYRFNGTYIGQIIQGNLSAGTHKFSFARFKEGLQSGIYFINIQSKHVTHQLKFLKLDP